MDDAEKLECAGVMRKRLMGSLYDLWEFGGWELAEMGLRGCQGLSIKSSFELPCVAAPAPSSGAGNPSLASEPFWRHPPDACALRS